MDTHFKNELAVIVRRNVKDLMTLHDLKTIKQLQDFIIATGTEIKYQRLNSALGKSPMYAPTEELIEIIEQGFGVEQGSLTKKNNGEKTIRLPSIIITVVPVKCEIGETIITTNVSKDVARKVLELIVLGDE